MTSYSTVATVFGCKRSVDSLDASSSKAVNFGIVYGISDYGLSRKFRYYSKKAKAFIDDYLASFPGVRHMSDIVKDAKALGYVVNIATSSLTRYS
ncbi:DNA polymerase [Staphylococcus aureus]